jgi:hypothetical protein
MSGPKKTCHGSFCPSTTQELPGAWRFVGVRYPNKYENHGLLIALCTHVVRCPSAV